MSTCYSWNSSNAQASTVTSTCAYTFTWDARQPQRSRSFRAGYRVGYAAGFVARMFGR